MTALLYVLSYFFYIKNVKCYKVFLIYLICILYPLSYLVLTIHSNINIKTCSLMRLTVLFSFSTEHECFTRLFVKNFYNVMCFFLTFFSWSAHQIGKLFFYHGEIFYSEI